jgi:hypothetical protein
MARYLIRIDKRACIKSHKISYVKLSVISLIKRQFSTTLKIHIMLNCFKQQTDAYY